MVVERDEDDGRTRRFTLSLGPLDTRACDVRAFAVRVPKAVIEDERPETWAADLREQLAYWINVNAIERGEMIWWPLVERADYCDGEAV